MHLLQVILLSALPALGFLILALVIGRWGKRHDIMGGRRGHIWTSDEPGSWATKSAAGKSRRSPEGGAEPTAKTPE